MHDELFQKMAQSIIDGEPEVAVTLAQQAVAAGIDPLAAIANGFVVGVNQVVKVFLVARLFCRNWSWLAKR
jgi:methanogenic corrinoid protein MtbC1